MIEQLSGSGNWVAPSNGVITVAVIGGGGGGASNQGGGGGAGGVIITPQIPVTAGQSFPYSVGEGGNGGPNSSRGNGTNGQNSTFGSFTAIGGGSGKGVSITNGQAGSGGSGGGGDGPTSGASFGGNGTSGQGNDGADSGVGTVNGIDTGVGGGGGGAGSPGGAKKPFPNNAIGGDGIDISSIFGTSVGVGGFVGGGGSARAVVADLPNGGLGGGGSGAGVDQPIPAEQGVDGTGGGGGAGANDIRFGGGGGRGAVIILLVQGPEVSELSDQTVPALSEVVLSVTATGAGQISYQWSKDSVLIPGQTGPSISFIANEDALYSVEVTDDNGSTVRQSQITVTLPTLEFTTDLEPEELVNASTPFSLLVEPTNGASVQWFDQDGEIEGATGNQLILVLTSDDSGLQVFARATDQFGQTTDSSTTTIRVVNAVITDLTEPKPEQTIERPSDVRYRR
ncbi:MAG: immunoglobulin domain-containing protein, partial [Bacteroidota bacterium]